jgi:hypothetical protein
MSTTIPLTHDEFEDKTRATSWYEYLLEPQQLHRHLNELKSGNVRNPSAHDLVKLFVKQSSLSMPQRSQLLMSFAVQVDVITYDNKMHCLIASDSI